MLVDDGANGQGAGGWPGAHCIVTGRTAAALGQVAAVVLGRPSQVGARGPTQPETLSRGAANRSTAAWGAV